MMPITDITGLAGSSILIAAVIAHLPGVARLHKRSLRLMTGAVVALTLIPLGELQLAAYVRGMIGDLSIPTVILLTLSILKPLTSIKVPDPRDQKTLLSLVVLAALALYPMALGFGLFDPYRLGYGNLWFLSGLLVAALTACFRRLPLTALVIALAVLAWGVGAYESTNLWDYLIDPLVAVYAMGVCIKAALARNHGK